MAETKTVQLSIPSYQALYKSLPANVRKQVEDNERKNREAGRQGWMFKDAYLHEVALLIEYVQQAEQGQAVLCTFEQHGCQYVATFWVNDLSRPKKDEHNWHGQNTSQWLYAGCILVQDGRVSTHH